MTDKGTNRQTNRQSDRQTDRQQRCDANWSVCFMYNPQTVDTMDDQI